MDILRLVSFEGSDSICGSIPEAVSLKSDDSSTNSELSDGFGAKPLTVAYNAHDRKRAQRNYFQLSDAVLDTFDALQYNCCGFDEDTSAMLDFDVQHLDHGNAFETKHSPDRVSVVVEVSRHFSFRFSNIQIGPLMRLSLFIITGNSNHVHGRRFRKRRVMLGRRCTVCPWKSFRGGCSLLWL